MTACSGLFRGDHPAYLNDEKHGIYRYLMEQKRNGRIKHLGFSCHGAMPVLERFLAAYGKDMEFCQLQLNYLDWTFQNGREKVALLNAWHIPVWVMEPLRGGKLASLAPAYEAELRALRPDEEIPAWTFRFLASIPSVTMILSGMFNEAQLRKKPEDFRDGPLPAKKDLRGVETVFRRRFFPGTA